MTIDEAIEHAREKAKEIRENIIDGNNLEPYESYCNAMTGRCAEEHEQLAEWLEDYKRIKMLIPIEQALKNEYNKAIDDFADKAQKECDIQNWSKNYGISFENLEKISEQLKAGGDNEL